MTIVLMLFIFFRPGNFTANDGKIYCKTHYMQLFKVKGNYKSGFAGETKVAGDVTGAIDQPNTEAEWSQWKEFKFLIIFFCVGKQWLLNIDFCNKYYMYVYLNQIQKIQ